MSSTPGRKSDEAYDRLVENGLRLRCVVPGCRCTTKILSRSEWICARHWAPVDKDVRDRYSDLKRRITRSGGDKVIEVFLRHWQLVKRQAVERSVGTWSPMVRP